MEQHLVGPVCARLESPRAQLPPAPRLPFLHQRLPNLPLLSHAYHFLVERVRTRAGHVVHIQETQGLPDGRADAAVATRRA